MLRVGLTGDLGSGKSTVARLLAAHGAHVFSADEIGRALMHPGQPVFAAIVERFGPGILHGDGTLDRAALARLAFDPAHPRIDELNAIVHPAVLAEQARLVAALEQRDPHAIAVVESALIFSTPHAGAAGWRARFDAVICVTAPEALKLERFLHRVAAGRTLSEAERATLLADARQRLAAQTNDTHAADCLLLENTGTLTSLEQAVDTLWPTLVALERAQTPDRPTQSAPQTQR